MKVFLLLILFIIPCLVKQAKFLSDKPGFFDTDIMPGIGYSSDRKNLAPTQCYNVVKVENGQQASEMNFQSAIDIQKLSQVFQIDFSLSSSAYIFSGNAQASYLRSLEEDSYSLTYFYYFKISSVTSVLFSYDPTTILNDIGKSIYNDGKNQYFRIFCGDKLITSFDLGASLIYSLQVNFFSRTDKENFQASVGLNIGSFLSASTKISEETIKNHIKGYISISAFQQGGDPTQLGKILNASILQCSLENVSACSDAAKGLIDYVNNSFPGQFTKDDHGIWTSPLVPLGGYSVDFSVEDIGLILSPSFVDNDVVAKRAALDDLYKKSNTINNLVNNIANNYPVPLEEKFGTLLQNYYNSFQKFKTYFLLGNGGYKAVDCYNIPYRCKDVYAEISSNWNADLVQKLKDDIKGLLNYMAVDDDVNFKVRAYRNGNSTCSVKSFESVNPYASEFNLTSCSINACGTGFDYSYREVYGEQFYCYVSRYADCQGNVLRGNFTCDDGSSDQSRDSVYSVLMNEVVSDILSFIP